jgi:hypothetical protein
VATQEVKDSPNVRVNEVRLLSLLGDMGMHSLGKLDKLKE